MPTNLPAVPAAIAVDASLTAALEPGTSTSLADPTRPIRGVLRARFNQVEALVALVGALRSVVVDTPPAVVAIDVAPGAPFPPRPDAAKVIWTSETDPIATGTGIAGDLWIQL